jgi:hypothetical protein
MTDTIAVPGCDREAISCSLSLFVRNLELGRMLHEYHLSKTSLAVMEDKLNHVRKNVNPALWAETFADDEDFYEAGYQPGDEVELFASDEAGQLAKKRLALLELAAGKAAPPATYSSACECAPPEREGGLARVASPASPASDGYWVSVSVSPEPSPKAKPAVSQLGHDLKNVALGRSVGGFKPTPSSSPSPAPPENSPTASERAEGSLQLQSFLQVAASDSANAGECRSIRLVRREEPSLIRSGVKPPGDERFWPIFAGADGEFMDKAGTRGSSLKRDAPCRMLDAPFSGVGTDDGAEGECRLCGLR